MYLWRLKCICWWAKNTPHWPNRLSSIKSLEHCRNVPPYHKKNIDFVVGSKCIIDLTECHGFILEMVCLLLPNMQNVFYQSSAWEVWEIYALGLKGWNIMPGAHTIYIRLFWVKIFLVLRHFYFGEGGKLLPIHLRSITRWLLRLHFYLLKVHRCIHTLSGILRSCYALFVCLLQLFIYCVSFVPCVYCPGLHWRNCSNLERLLWETLWRWARGVRYAKS